MDRFTPWLRGYMGQGKNLNRCRYMQASYTGNPGFDDNIVRNVIQLKNKATAEN